jgi:hypothetical protein
MSIKALVYDTSTGKWYAQNLGSAQISDNAIISAKLGSGAVGAIHMAPFTSGYVILGQGVAAAPIYGAVPAGTVGDETITSAKLASGAVIGDRLAYGAVLSGHIGANVIATPHIANQGILSASIGANIIDTALIKNQGVLSASIGTNVLDTAHIKNQGILSASIGIGSIGNGHIADNGIVSGKYAPASITEAALASGISIDIAETLQEPSFRAGDLISAFLGVQFSISGYFNYSQAGGVRMPAVGVAANNINSGAIGTILMKGRVTNGSWDFSGHIGELVFVGTSSEVTVAAPSASGQCVQRFGKVIGGQTVYLTPELTYVSLAE